MVKLQLLFKAELENITSVAPESNINWYLKLKCMQCGEENDKPITINEDETEEVPGSRGEAHLVMKCKGCRRDCSIEIVSGTRKAYTTSGKFAPFITLDCRGIEVTDYKPMDGFIATAENGTTFEVDFTEGDWTDYNEKASESVGIYGFETKVDKTK